MPIVLNGTTGITTPTYNGSTTAEYLVPVTGFKNRIINGDMGINQRAWSGAIVTDGQYTLDRWGVFSVTASKVSVSQNAGSVTPPAGFNNYLGITSLAATSLSATDYYMLYQRIEGFNTADFNFGSANAQTITLSFWVRSSLTGTFGGSLQNNAQNRTYPFTYTISAANTWEQKSVTVAGSTDGTWATNNTEGMGLYFGLGVGSTYSGTAGAWRTTGAAYSATGATSVVGTNGATFYITGVQLEKGSVATSFDYLDYGREMMLCQRYYQTCGTWSGNANNSTLWLGIFSWCVKMRANPTLGVTGPIVISDFRAADPVQSSASMGAVLGYSENSACAFLPNYTGLRNDVFYGGNRNTNANYVTLSSEL